MTMLRLPALPTLLLLLLAPAAVAAQDGWADRLRPTAEALWRQAGPVRRIAARPVQADVTGLPAAVAAAIDRALVEALLRAAPAAGRLVDRSGLPASWEEAESFRGTSSEALLRAAAVDALVIPSAHATADGIAVSATLVAVAGGDTGRLLAAVPAVVLPGAVDRLTARPPAVAAKAAGFGLADSLRQGLDPGARFRASVRLSGERSPFGDWFLDQVAEHLTARLAERPLYVSRPLRDADAGGRPVALRLEGEVWDHGRQVEVHLRVIAGAAEARATARLEATALPGHFLPLTPAGGRLGTGFRIADGAAAVGAELRRDELAVAAEAIARALLVDEALDRRDTTPPVARSRSAVAEAWRRLAEAVPYEETWSGAADDRNASARRLRARVARLGGPAAPELAATLERAVYRPGEPLRVRATVARGRAFLALYAWQADGTVVRVAPIREAVPVTAEAGRRIELPGPRDAEVAAAPMPGVSESLEALVVVASAVPFVPDRLAPAAAGSADSSRAAGVSTGAFLDRLAGLDRARLRLAILPYRARAGG
jgi:hypothetical protein